jgi:hypothetical protein
MTLKKYAIKSPRNVKHHLFFNQAARHGLEDIQTILELQTALEISSGSAYQEVSRYIERLVHKSGFLCRGLNPDYVVESLASADAVVVVGSSMRVLPNGNVFGFASIVFDEPTNAIYVDVICTHVGIQGAGHFLMTTLEEICRALLMTKLYLTSVESAIPFYKKYGFVQHDASCRDMCLMTKRVKADHVKQSPNVSQKNKKKGKTTRKVTH